MNTLLKEAIARRKNPEKYDFEQLQIKLEKQRADSLKEMLSLTPIIEYLNGLVLKETEAYETRIGEVASDTSFEIAEIGDKTRSELSYFVQEKVDEVNAHFKNVQDTITANTARFGKDSEATVEFVRETFKKLEADTKDEIQRIFSDVERFKGEKGDKGDDGDKGDTGDSVKLEDILEEIKPELTRIREEVKKVASQKQSGGGGMGNLQHESKAVSSGTTSVNTTYTVAGGGYAIWAYYQGQLIMRGVHYTVSGKTINLLFTPEDNTTIDVIYHR